MLLQADRVVFNIRNNALGFATVTVEAAQLDTTDTLYDFLERDSIDTAISET